MLILRTICALLFAHLIFLAGCGGGGGGGSGESQAKTATGTITVAGVPTPIIYGLKLKVTCPAGATFINAVKSGVSPMSSIITWSTLSATETNVELASSTGFSAGEVMKVNFSTVPQSATPASFDVSVLAAIDSNGAPSLTPLTTATISTVIN